MTDSTTTTTALVLCDLCETPLTDSNSYYADNHLADSCDDCYDPTPWSVEA